MYIFAAWWAEFPLGLPWLVAQLLAVLAGLIVSVVTATVGWKVYVAIRRYTTARRRARAAAIPAAAEAEPAQPPLRPAEPAALAATSARSSSALGPARDAPYRESAVLPPARTASRPDRSG
ncbi:MAG TPA: hypothetical protein VF163_21925 [Micromonosporaceae bacterium]